MEYFLGALIVLSILVARDWHKEQETTGSDVIVWFVGAFFWPIALIFMFFFALFKGPSYIANKFNEKKVKKK